MYDTMNERIEDLLLDNKEELTKDSIAAMLCLEDEMTNIKAAIELLKSGKIFAVYRGDRSIQYDPDEFLLMSKSEFEEEQAMIKTK